MSLVSEIKNSIITNSGQASWDLVKSNLIDELLDVLIDRIKRIKRYYNYKCSTSSSNRYN